MTEYLLTPSPMNKLITLLLLIVALGCGAQPVRNKVLLVSFDGFRYDYLSKAETPNFDKLVAEGVKSDGLIPVFPTKTFPNHYAIATGLYPENNKLIANSMYDPDLDLRYSISQREQVENPVWYGGEPIWNTAEKNGVRAGTMFWVGSEAPVQKMRPTFWKTYDGSMDQQTRIDSVIQWMTLGTDKEIDLATLYFSQVDSRGHRFGPGSPELIGAVEEADSLVGYLLEQLIAKGLSEITNVIFVSDHGMAEVSRERIIVLDDYINPDQVEIIEGTPSLMMNVISGDVLDIYEQLKEAEEPMQVYTRTNLPDRFHLKKSRRVPDLIVIPDIGYTVNTSKYFDSRPSYPSGGTHGFDNEAKEMQGLFLVYGPDFKQALSIPPVENIQIYELMAHLLGIPPAQNDGNLKVLEMILSN